MDLADACIFVLKHYSEEGFLNVGTGEDITVAEFASLVADTVGYNGKFVFDTSKPDGTPRKLLDVSRIHALGWRHQIHLRRGIERTYEWFLENHDTLRDGRSRLTATSP